VELEALSAVEQPQLAGAADLVLATLEHMTLAVAADGAEAPSEMKMVTMDCSLATNSTALSQTVALAVGEQPVIHIPIGNAM
jgi:hypothetical protein